MQEEEILNFDQELFFVERWGVDERRVVISNSPSCLAFNDPPQKIMVEWKKDAQGDIFVKIKESLFRIYDYNDNTVFGELLYENIEVFPCEDYEEAAFEGL